MDEQTSKSRGADDKIFVWHAKHLNLAWPRGKALKFSLRLKQETRTVVPNRSIKDSRPFSKALVPRM